IPQTEPCRSHAGARPWNGRKIARSGLKPGNAFLHFHASRHDHGADWSGPRPPAGPARKPPRAYFRSALSRLRSYLHSRITHTLAQPDFVTICARSGETIRAEKPMREGPDRPRSLHRYGPLRHTATMAKRYHIPDPPPQTMRCHHAGCEAE